MLHVISLKSNMINPNTYAWKGIMRKYCSYIHMISGYYSFTSTNMLTSIMTTYAIISDAPHLLVSK